MKPIRYQNPMIWEATKLLFEWVKKNEYIGWDPYDGLNSIFIQKLCGGKPFLEILCTQLNVYSIINLRPILKIEKGKDTKGYALFAQAYVNLYTLTRSKTYKKELERCTSFIKKMSLKKKYNFDCWSSHYFPYISLDKIKHMPSDPDIIGTSQAIIALVKSYKILRDEDLKDKSISGATFIINNLLEKYKDDYFLKYYLSPEHNTLVFNASAQGLECLSHVLSINEDKEIQNTCEKIVKFLIKNQKKDGSWAYSIRKNGQERMQLDFHHGYMIDGLLAFLPYSNNKKAIVNCINKGAKFYKSTLFLMNGQSYYRYPDRYPVDIHNQSQGIITFGKLSIIDPVYLEFAKKIAEWTITNMQDPSGCFYHQKWPFFTNKISYMRWGQAWMMIALSSLLEVMNLER